MPATSRSRSRPSNVTDLTRHGESYVASWVTGGAYVALHTSDPGATPDGSTEVGASDYARLATSSGDWSASGTGPRVAENAVALDFGYATSTWGTVTHLSLWDAETGGNCRLATALPSSLTVDTNEAVRFSVGSLTISID